MAVSLFDQRDTKKLTGPERLYFNLSFVDVVTSWLLSLLAAFVMCPFYFFHFYFLNLFYIQCHFLHPFFSLLLEPL